MLWLLLSLLRCLLYDSIFLCYWKWDITCNCNTPNLSRCFWCLVNVNSCFLFLLLCWLLFRLWTFLIFWWWIFTWIWIRRRITVIWRIMLFLLFLLVFFVFFGLNFFWTCWSIIYLVCSLRRGTLGFSIRVII